MPRSVFQFRLCAAATGRRSCLDLESRAVSGPVSTSGFCTRLVTEFLRTVCESVRSNSKAATTGSEIVVAPQDNGRPGVQASRRTRRGRSHCSNVLEKAGFDMASGAVNAKN